MSCRESLDMSMDVTVHIWPFGPRRSPRRSFGVAAVAMMATAASRPASADHRAGGLHTSTKRWLWPHGISRERIGCVTASWCETAYERPALFGCGYQASPC